MNYETLKNGDHALQIVVNNTSELDEARRAWFLKVEEVCGRDNYERTELVVTQGGFGDVHIIDKATGKGSTNTVLPSVNGGFRCKNTVNK
ncbi:hypothetical protein R50072_01970 [Simiduia litorea]|uniref:hypothetical protein n=1 Tax=Simiduia litorea TaxID=1435348 RepID=UPI0036F36EE3